MIDHEMAFTDAKALIRSFEATRVDDAPKTCDEYIALRSAVQKVSRELRPLCFRPQVSHEAATLIENLTDAWHRVRTMYDDARRRAAEGGPP